MAGTHVEQFRPFRPVTSALENAQILAERKLVELKLIKNEISLKKAQWVAHVGSWTWHIQSNQLEWSDEMFNIFGVKKEDFTENLTDVIARAIHPDDRAKVDQVNQLVIKNAKPMPLEYRIIWPDGTVRVVSAEAGESICDESGNIATLSGIVQDITERKRIELQLADEERHYATLLSASPVGVFETDRDGKCTSTSMIAGQK